MREQECRNKTLITEKIKLKESVAHTTARSLQIQRRHVNDGEPVQN